MRNKSPTMLKRNYKILSLLDSEYHSSSADSILQILTHHCNHFSRKYRFSGTTEIQIQAIADLYLKSRLKISLS